MLDGWLDRETEADTDDESRLELEDGRLEEDEAAAVLEG